MTTTKHNTKSVIQNAPPPKPLDAEAFDKKDPLQPGTLAHGAQAATERLLANVRVLSKAQLTELLTALKDEQRRRTDEAAAALPQKGTKVRVLKKGKAFGKTGVVYRPMQTKCWVEPEGLAPMYLAVSDFEVIS